MARLSRESFTPSRVLAFLLVLLPLLALAGYIWNHYRILNRSEAELAETIEQLDRDDPNWRFEDLQRNRIVVIDAENSGRIVQSLDARRTDRENPFPKLGLFDEGLADDTEEPNYLCDFETYDLILHALEREEEALKQTKLVARYPRGSTPLSVDDKNYVHGSELWPISKMSGLLAFDIERRMLLGDSDLVIVNCLAALNLGRSIGDEHWGNSQRERVIQSNRACRYLEHALALGSGSDRIRLLQPEFLKESHENRFLLYLQGKRGLAHQEFEEWAIQATCCPGCCGIIEKPYSIGDSLKIWHYGKYYPSYNATFLRDSTKWIEIAKLTESQQIAKIRSFVPEPLCNNFVKIEFFGSQFTNIWQSDFRGRALLRCASVGIAVERFRVLNNRWPNSLDEIPKNILPEIPNDPFDGKPLKYVRRADGASVYSIGQNQLDEGGKVPKQFDGHDQGDIVFRLYDPDQRGLPPK